MHVRDAMKIGETSQRLFLLDAWRETTLFTEKRTSCSRTEAMTLIANNLLKRCGFDDAKNHLTNKEMAW